jgi:uncharacterized membrane protein HdeD (DUF308 family)
MLTTGLIPLVAVLFGAALAGAALVHAVHVRSTRLASIGVSLMNVGVVISFLPAVAFDGWSPKIAALGGTVLLAGGIIQIMGGIRSRREENMRTSTR